MTIRIFPLDVSSGASAVGFDATLSEEVVYASTPAQAPTERGTPTTDNIRNEPIAIAAEVLVTDTPGSVNFYGMGSFVNKTVDTVYGPSSQFVFELPPGTDMAAETETRLEAIRRARTTCTVVLTTGYHSDMVLTTFQRVRATPGRSGRFRLTFQQIQVVGSVTVAAPQPKEPKGQGKVAVGKAPAGPLDKILSDLTKPGRSTAVNLIDVLRNF